GRYEDASKMGSRSSPRGLLVARDRRRMAVSPALARRAEVHQPVHRRAGLCRKVERCFHLVQPRCHGGWPIVLRQRWQELHPESGAEIMHKRVSFFAPLIVALSSGIAAPAEWQAVTTDLLAREKPGYGGLSGVVVDHPTGHIFVDLSDRGVFRSADRGKSWE